jgi:hypothetical protein
MGVSYAIQGQLKRLYNILLKPSIESNSESIKKRYRSCEKTNEQVIHYNCSRSGFTLLNQISLVFEMFTTKKTVVSR